MLWFNGQMSIDEMKAFFSWNVWRPYSLFCWDFFPCHWKSPPPITSSMPSSLCSTKRTSPFTQSNCSLSSQTLINLQLHRTWVSQCGFWLWEMRDVMVSKCVLSKNLYQSDGWLLEPADILKSLIQMNLQVLQAGNCWSK